MLSLKNFEKQTDPMILKRGEKYFQNGSVTFVEELEDGVWSAEVEGSEIYNVEVTIKGKDSISDLYCDCPYDEGICKHIVAVLFALQNEILKPGEQPVNAKKDSFETLLKSITQVEYQNFVSQYSKQNKNFKIEFELFFADKDSRTDLDKKYSELVSRLIKKHSNRDFIDYRSSVGLSKELRKLLTTGSGFISQNNFIGAFALAKAVLRPIVHCFNCCDDSSGSLGDTVGGVIGLFEDIISAKAVAIDMKERVFYFLGKELNDNIYFEYGDFGYYMFSLFRDLALQLEKGSVFLSYANTQVSKLNDPDDSYQSDFFKKEIIAFLRQTGKTAEAEKLEHQNIDIVEVRMEVVREMVTRKDFATAKKVIKAGIKIAESKSHGGTVDQWKQELLTIAKLENDVPAIRGYTKYFAFQRGVGEEYYHKWKTTFTPDEWRQTIESHITDTTQKIINECNKRKNSFLQSSVHSFLLESLGPIYVLEEFWDRLLILLQQVNSLAHTLAYHTYLVKDYPAALLALYLPALENDGINANNRNEYAALVKTMKKIIKEIPEGKMQVLQVAQRLKTRFSTKPRRPAMVEELDQILKTPPGQLSFKIIK